VPLEDGEGGVNHQSVKYLPESPTEGEGERSLMGIYDEIRESTVPSTTYIHPVPYLTQKFIFLT